MPPRPYIGDLRKPPDPDEPVIPGLAPGLRWHNDWFADPYSSPEVQARRKRERRARWIASLTEADWSRLRERAALVMAGGHFARFDDLEAPIAVAVVHPEERMPSGERFGVLGGAILMAFQKRPSGQPGP